MGVDFVEQAVAVEVAEDTVLDNVLQLVPVLGREPDGLMEASLPIDGP